MSNIDSADHASQLVTSSQNTDDQETQASLRHCESTDTSKVHDDDDSLSIEHVAIISDN